MAQYWAEARISRPDQLRPRFELHQARVGEVVSLLWNTKNEQPNAQAIVADWVKNEKFYNRKEECFSDLAGTFTQLVWKSSLELGVGFAYNPESHKTLIVTYYYPAGNINGLFGENVPQIE